MSTPVAITGTGLGGRTREAAASAQARASFADETPDGLLELLTSNVEPTE
ncbi:hypothetical protein LWP59_17730 [Amycolatopsis acidiphila]|nr:hypothetical protein [Amycolatopsis acidiphila]UIJ63345.1 hypothetical protein LWP59_17730 [Amycolatopsis acidiphila]GHG75120.1 hypothetical protein GCM10017788_39680 [Amycolatopsis acidiphila]